MRTLATTLNGRKLFGELSDMAMIRDKKDGFEKHWEWPHELGRGYLSVMKLKQGLILGKSDYSIHKPVNVAYVNNYAPITIGFGLVGKLIHTMGEKLNLDFCYCQEGHCTITKLPEGEGLVRLPEGHVSKSIGIFIDPEFLGQILDEEHSKLPDNIADIVNSRADRLYYHRSQIDTAANCAVTQIMDNNKHPLKRLFLESKTLELVANSIGRIIDPRNTAPTAPVLMVRDMDRILQARDILLANLEHPPSLGEISKKVGINKNKLNHCFRQAFGTSVFDYLRISRLEKARELLESRQKNVTEVAFEVGYSQHSSFTKAFKKHFGASPTEHLYCDRI